MDYESMNIKDAVNALNKTIFLPAIQREFVWEPNRIEKLFDSLMGDYPISSFLFWKVDDENKKEWNTYEFVRNYNKENSDLKEANLTGIKKDIWLVLDGQQRLSALYIGLKGSYKYFHYRLRDTELYLNLLKEPAKNEDEPEELVYQFKFRESGEPDDPENEYWYKVGRILEFMDPEDAKEDLDKDIQDFSTEQKRNARKLIGNFHSRIFIYPFINYYPEKSKDTEKVMEVFIRANTGGKQLEYSDILLSKATAKWKNHNARKELSEFTNEINEIGAGYNFGKDFVLKGCLYLTENLPIQYKIKNFTKTNLEKIEDNWINIKKNIEDVIKLVTKFGFNSKNIVAAGALLPIAFYLQKLDKKNFVESSKKEDVDNQTVIQKWLIFSLLKNAFGGSSDTTLKNMRNILVEKSSYERFPSEELLKKLGIESSFTETELENNFKVSYKSRYSYLMLSLLYPDRDWKDRIFHEDHIFPKSEFTVAKLRKRGYDDATIENYRKYYNTILNLQLLTYSENLEKKAKSFDDWITTRDENFKDRHTIPELSDYSFDNFIEFIDKRKELITEKQKSVSGIQN